MRPLSLLAIVVAVAALLAPPPALSQGSLEIPPPTVGRTDSSLTRVAPDYTTAVVLTGSAAKTVSVPTAARFVFFSMECNFWARRGASAVIPVADVTDGTSPELNPPGWYIPSGVTQITLNASVACKGSLTWQK